MRLFVFHHAKVPASITLHVIDIYYTELNRLIDQKRESTEEGENNTDISKEINIPVHLLIDPIVELSVNTNNNMIFNRIKTEFYDEIMGEDSVFKKDVITCLQNHSDNIPTDPNDLSPDHEFYTINKNKYNLFKQFITIEQNSNSAETVTRNSKTSKTSKTGTDKEGKENKEKTERPKKRKTKLPEIIPQESTLISSSAEPVTGDDENVDPLTGFVIAHKSGTPKKPKLSSPPEPVTPTSSAPVETVNSTSSSKNLKWALDKNTTKTFNKMVPIAPVAPSVNFEATPKRSALRKSLDSQSPSASSSSRSKNSKNSKIAKNAKSPKNNLLLNTLANSYSEAIDDNDILLANIKN
ncbi:hypothetical protein AX774_g3888 [Zancudomyces culisetae]|uniref:Uncharacterized protein n=1 Tax=Zancudomyces culisetae TaxID=1213189 RepID=A0A1R1PNS3_ZANCU|nr:hypothetical protein AX774_g3888 [Zancudomyces culisetae]|eukprot:OMH82625.1 hypothetical protein AX774_g3888 [Zancudomyces culisetae]